MNMMAPCICPLSSMTMTMNICSSILSLMASIYSAVLFVSREAAGNDAHSLPKRQPLNHGYRGRS